MNDQEITACKNCGFIKTYSLGDKRRECLVCRTTFLKGERKLKDDKGKPERIRINIKTMMKILKENEFNQKFKKTKEQILNQENEIKSKIQEQMKLKSKKETKEIHSSAEKQLIKKFTVLSDQIQDVAQKIKILEEKR